MTAQLEDMFAPVIGAMGYDLWGVEQVNQGRQTLLKVYINKADGINVEDCATVSRQLSALLDVEEPIAGEYTLEVSSPGLDCRLFKLEQFEEFRGSQVRLNLRRSFEGRRKYRGLLVGVEDDEVVLRTSDNEEVLFPFEDIDRAVVVPEF